MDNAIESKSFQFAVRICKLNQYLCEKKQAYTLSNQILKSGTSIGANVCEAQQAQSRADFLSKLSIALKEAAETDYWLRLLHATEHINDQQYASLIEDCRELERLLTAIIKRAKT